MAPSALPAPTSVWHLVDEQDDVALGGLNLLQHRLEPLLELAAELGAGDHGAQVERHQPLVAQRFRHIAIDDSERQPLDDRRLADAGLADQDRVVLGPARQDLDGAADLLVAADHRVELALAAELGDVASILLERVEIGFGRRAIHGAALADVGDRLLQRRGTDAGAAKRAGSGRIAAGKGQ